MILYYTIFYHIVLYYIIHIIIYIYIYIYYNMSNYIIIIIHDSDFHPKCKRFCANRRCKTRMTRWASSLLSERVGPPSPLRLDSLVIISKALFQIGSSRLKCGQLCPAHEILARLFRVHELVPLPSVTALESNKTATPDFDTSASANIYICKYCLII